MNLIKDNHFSLAYIFKPQGNILGNNILQIKRIHFYWDKLEGSPDSDPENYFYF